MKNFYTKMKYNTISGGSLTSESKKATLTIYADMDISQNKLMYTESQMASIRGELEIVQKALKLQTKRCSQLVAEYTRKLQEKEQQFQTEKTLRDDQLGKVLKALLIVEARLRQEQKLITHQLNEKDYIIKTLLSNQYCKNCNQLYRSSPLQESLDSNYDFESLDSSSETYLSEKGSSDTTKNNLYQKNRNNTKDSIGRRARNKFPHRKSVGTYFEVLKIRNENSSPFSNEDNTSNDYDNLDSLPTESKNDTGEEMEENRTKITDAIPIFDGDETNDNNWYATSDQEDEQQRDIYRDNPVLECMNQILLQNMQDNCNSPPKTPNIERKSTKRVKFSDEEQENALTMDNLKESSDYYETPIQKPANFYETPQSIYSNDYEQILTKTNEQDPKNHYYIDMDTTTKMENNKDETAVVVRKSKILRTPPALPPKPANLTSRYRPSPPPKDSNSSEPDYCSISELNLPPKSVSFKKINVVAEINAPTSNDVRNKLEKAANNKKELPPPPPSSTNLVVKKCVEKLNIQIAKQTAIKSEKPDQDIPKLPQVSEIIIPDEEDEKNDRISQDNYVKNNSQIFKTKPATNENNLTTRHPIVVGSSVSSLITGFNNQLLSEIKKKPKNMQFTSFENMQNFDKTATNFDLSQNFEEFKLDDCEIEEYKVDDEDVDEKSIDVARVDIIRATNDLLIPTLNTNSVELLKKQLENHENRTSEATYEHFLECTGLSSKSILTPSRLMSNHKSMLKPKDVKLRSKVKANQFFEKNNTNNSKKYWSEPYI